MYGLPFECCGISDRLAGGVYFFDQFINFNGFCDYVLATGNAGTSLNVILIYNGSHIDDGDGAGNRVREQCIRHLGPGHAGHHDIQQDDIRPLFLCRVYSLIPARRGQHLKFVIYLQVLFDGPTEKYFIVNNQYFLQIPLPIIIRYDGPWLVLTGKMI